MNKLTKAIAAGVLAIGLAFATSTPAQAVTLYRYCNWPYKSSINVDFPGVSSGSATAYSPGGAYLGRRTGTGGLTWKSPWEDVKWVPSSYVTVTTYCQQ